VEDLDLTCPLALQSENCNKDNVFVQDASTVEVSSTHNVDMRVCFSISASRDEVQTAVNCEAFDSWQRNVFVAEQQPTAYLSQNDQNSEARLYAKVTPNITAFMVGGSLSPYALKIVPDDTDLAGQEGQTAIKQEAAETSGVSGWKLMRYLPEGAATWHQATNNLMGTDVYGGDSGVSVTQAGSWSVEFGEFYEFFISTGGMSTWVYCLKASVGTALYASTPESRPIMRSSFKLLGPVFGRVQIVQL